MLHNSGRRGFWITFNDMTAGSVQTPSPASFDATMSGHNGSKFAARTTGHGFTDWGAVMAFTPPETR